MRRADIIVASVLILIGVIVLGDSIRLGFKWGMSGPEAGFFPFYLAIGLIISSCLNILKAVKKIQKEGSGGRLIPEGGLKPILWVVFPASAMILLTGLVGLHIAALVYLVFYMRVVGKIGWAKVTLISVLVPLSLYIIFDKLFLVPLPQGLWGAKLLALW